MFGQGVQFTGDSLEASKFGFTNKTGQQLVKGGVYALDLSSTDSTTTSLRTRISNLVAIAAANIAGILLVAETATNPGEVGNGVIMGITNALVNGGATSAVNEVQTVAISGTLSAGTYTISFLNAAGVLESTTPIAFGASLATVNTALDGVSGGVGRIVATGTAQSAMVLTFSGTGYAGLPQDPVLIETQGLTGLTTVTVTRTTHGAPANAGGAGSPGARLKAVAGQSYLTACSADIGNQDLAIALQLDQTFGQITAPSAPTLAAQLTGGTLAGSQTLYVKTAWQGAGGVTTPSGETNVAISASNLPINSVLVTSGSTTPTGAQAMVVYVGTATGAEVVAGSVAAGAVGSTPTFTITQLPSSGNAAPNASNSTGTQLATVFFCGVAFMGSNLNPALS